MTKKGASKWEIKFTSSLLIERANVTLFSSFFAVICCLDSVGMMRPKRLVFTKKANKASLCVYFHSFQSNKLMWKNSTQYLSPGFKLTTSWLTTRQWHPPKGSFFRKFVQCNYKQLTISEGAVVDQRSSVLLKGLLFLYLRLFYSVQRRQLFDKNMPTTGFETRSFAVGIAYSANFTTATGGQVSTCRRLPRFIRNVVGSNLTV